MSETPFFDSTSADNEEVAITVHDETVELRNWNGHGRLVRNVVKERLEFNFNEPYRGVSPYTHPSMPGTGPMDTTTRPQDWSPLQRPLAFGESA